MNIIPFVSIGDFTFGDSRNAIRERLPTQPTTFVKSAGENETDAYDAVGCHCYFNECDCLEYVETFLPAAPTLNGLRMLGRSANDVQKDLQAAGYRCSWMDDTTLNFESAGIVLYVPDGTVHAVGAYRKGYFDV